jgi:hypothetical protein
MAKRFTDSKKWRNEWFRTLPLKAKLAWVYLCDECESHGVIKMDYGLASFQLDFKIDRLILSEWFRDKLHFMNDENILIVQFFEFQYGESKDSWSAKYRAKEKLEAMGFSIENNKLIIPPSHSTPTVVDGGATCLIRVRVNKKEESEEKTNSDFEAFYSLYPRKVKRTAADKAYRREIRAGASHDEIINVLGAYKTFCAKEKKEDRFIVHPSTFLGEWNDWARPDAGKTERLRLSPRIEAAMPAEITNAPRKDDLKPLSELLSGLSAFEAMKQQKAMGTIGWNSIYKDEVKK